MTRNRPHPLVNASQGGLMLDMEGGTEGVV